MHFVMQFQIKGYYFAKLSDFDVVFCVKYMYTELEIRGVLRESILILAK